MSKVMVFDHPMIQHKVGIIRDENTDHKLFKELVSEIGMFMAYEVTRDLPLEEVTVKTPLCETTVKRVCADAVAIIPILRAGLGMVDGMLTLLPNARVGHVGLYRDEETAKPVSYYCKLPENITTATCIVLDPMLATGGSAVAAVDFLKERGAKNIKFMCIIAAPEGIETLSAAHPDVEIYCAAKDEGLNERKYIVPGLGDAGDRIFGTK